MPKSDFGNVAFRKQLGVNQNEKEKIETKGPPSSRQRQHSNRIRVVGPLTPDFGGDPSWRNSLDPLKYRNQPPENGEGGSEVAIIYPVRCAIDPSASIDAPPPLDTGGWP